MPARHHSTKMQSWYTASSSVAPHPTPPHPTHTPHTHTHPHPHPPTPTHHTHQPPPPHTQGSLALAGSDGARRVYLSSPLRRQKVKAEAKLTELDMAVRPASATIAPLAGPRDSPLPNGRPVYRSLLTYNVTLSEAGKYTPRTPLLNK
jgi:hypothetical protein